MRCSPLLVAVLVLFAGCMDLDREPQPNAAPAPQVAVDPLGAVSGGTLVTLDASGSTDADARDRDRLEFRWEQLAGGVDAVTLDALVGPVVRFAAPRRPQTLQFVVHVSDGLVEVPSPVVRVDVVNAAPVAVARAEPEGPVTGGTVVTLDGSGSADPDSADAERLAFRWEQVATAGSVALDDSTAAVAHFTAPRQPQTLLFRLRVSDGIAEAVSRDVAVLVVNSAPVPLVTVDPAGELRGGTLVTLDATGSTDVDAGDAGRLEFRWEQVGGTDSVTFDTLDGPVARFEAPRQPQSLQFVVYVSDGLVEVPSAVARVDVINAAPSAAARIEPEGPVSGGAVVTLDGSDSADPDPGDSARLGFFWEQVGGDPVLLETPDAPVTRFEAPSQPQTLIFVLHVSDGIATTRSAPLRVEVADAAPVVVLRTDPEGPVASGVTVTLDASGSTDPDPGDTARLTFRWEQLAGDPVSASGLLAPVLRFAAPQGAQTLVFLLHVSDGVLETTEQAVLDVTGTEPLADAGADRVVRPGQRVQLDASASSDEDGDRLTFAWRQTEGPEVVLTGAQTATAELVAPEGAALLRFAVTVSDGRNAAQDEVAVEVTPLPEARISLRVGDAEAQDATGRAVAVGDSERLVLDASASTVPEGSSLSGVRWTFPAELLDAIAGLAEMDSLPVLPVLAPARATSFVVGLQALATRGDGSEIASDPARVTIIVNVRPVARPGPPREVLNRTSVRLNGTESEGITYEWRVLGTPPGGECCGHEQPGCPVGVGDPPELRGCLSGATTPTPVFTPFARGDYTLELLVANAAGVRSLPAYTLVTALNNRPRADAGPNVTTPNHQTIELLAGYADADGDLIHPVLAPGSSLRWELRSVPAGATLEFEPVAADPLRFLFTPHGKGTYLLSLRVHDGEAESEADDLAIMATNLQPLADPVASAGGPNRAAIGLSAGASRDGDGDPLSYEWSVVALPEGGSGAFSDRFVGHPSFTPDGRGTYQLRLVVHDGTVSSEPALVTLESLNNPPLADPGRDLDNHNQVLLRLDGGLSSDADGDAIVAWRWRQVSGPEVAAVAGADSPTPVVELAQAGTHRFGLVVGDGLAESAEAVLTVQVTGLNRPPVADAGPDQVVLPGALVTLTGAGVDPEGEAVRTFLWTRESGSNELPAMLAGASPTFRAPDAFDMGDFDNNQIRWRLEVTDAGGALSLPDHVWVRVAPEESKFIYVVPNGTDSDECGTLASPCATITQGIDRARTPERGQEGHNVALAGGVYDSEPVRSVVLPEGIRVWGGWDPVTWQRDPQAFASELRPQPSLPPEVVDLRDNDCDGKVDEHTQVAGESCNNYDDDDDGTADEGQINCWNPCAPDRLEPNNDAGQATALALGRRYERMSLCHGAAHKYLTDVDWFSFELPLSLPPDPDGAGPLRAPVELVVLHNAWDARYNAVDSPPVVLELLDSSHRLIAGLTTLPNGSAEGDRIVATGLAAGTYHVAVRSANTNKECCAPNGHVITQPVYSLQVDLRPAAETLGDSNPWYCGRAATLYVPPMEGTPSESAAPLVDGLRVIGLSTGVPASALRAADPDPRAVLCDRCVVRLRQVELFANGVNSTDALSAAFEALSPVSVLPEPGQRARPGVLIEDSYLRTGFAARNAAIVLNDAVDFAVRRSTIVGDTSGNETSETRLVRLRGESGTSGSTRGELSDSSFFLEASPSQSGPCAALSLESWTGVRVWNNVFDLRADCGVDGDEDINNSAVLFAGGRAHTRQTLVSNVFVGSGEGTNASRLIGGPADCVVGGTFLRNNYVTAFARGVEDCSSGGESIVQHNVFFAVAEPWRQGGGVVEAASLASDPAGALGPQPDSHNNLVAECEFAPDWANLEGSPCLEVGSSAEPPEGVDWAVELFSVDRAGLQRPVDLLEVDDGWGDGTDVGPVERR